MANSMRAAAVARQSPPDDVVQPGTSTTVDHDLSVLRQVIADLDWTCEAIAAAMGRGESYKTHVSRVVNGERPMSHEFIKALPDEIEIEWHARLAEQGGRIVVAPATDHHDAMKQTVAGLLGLLAPQLPVKASRMARAAIAPAVRKAVR